MIAINHHPSLAHLWSLVCLVHPQIAQAHPSHNHPRKTKKSQHRQVAVLTHLVQILFVHCGLISSCNLRDDLGSLVREMASTPAHDEVDTPHSSLALAGFVPLNFTLASPSRHSNLHLLQPTNPGSVIQGVCVLARGVHL